MKVSYNWLKRYVKQLPKPEKLVDLLTMHSFETKISEKIRDDYILDADILPDRAHDCLSHIGIARECSAITGVKINIPICLIKEDKNLKTENYIKVDIKDKENCFRYSARIIDDIKVGPSPDWLKKRLEVLGQKSINNIVDATNYIMFETGQPLHAFDYDKLTGKKIIVRKAKKGEKIITLDNEKFDLNKDILVIADNDPLALAGVKGGKKAEIDKKTKTIVLESASFNYKNIRKTSLKINIKTEASFRFEHELDPNLTEKAINMVSGLIHKIAGGKIAKGLVDIYPKKVLPKKIKLNLDKIENFTGIKISKNEVIKKLKLLGFKVDNSLKIEVPTFRQDITIEEDLIEEIVRLIGYEKIPARLPFGLLGINKTNEEFSIIDKVKNIFEAIGFFEVYNFSFIGEEDLKITGVDKNHYLELENYLSVDLKYLRKDLLINLLKNIKDNTKKQIAKNGIKIFELGKTYHKISNKIKEEKMLAGLIALKEKKSKADIFYELKGIIDALLNRLGITDQWYDNFQATPEWTDDIFWQEDITAEIKIGDKEIGFVGNINPEILKKIGIKDMVAGFNLNFDKLLNLVKEELIYQPSSSFPSVIRDLAVLVDREDKVVDVLNIINRIGGDLISDVDLFDMYEGGGLPQNKKSLAFHIVYQSYKKTLTDKEVNKIQNKIIKEFENNNWKIRK